MKRRRNLILTMVPVVSAGIFVLGWIFSTSGYPEIDGETPPELATPLAGKVGFSEVFALGVHRLQVGRAKDAVVAFEQARKLRPGQPEVHVNLGYSNLIDGDYGAAERSFRTAIDYRPNQVNAYYGWAVSLDALEDPEAALGAMRTFIHLADENDPFLRKARAAEWEWSEAIEQQRAVRHVAIPAIDRLSSMRLPALDSGREPFTEFVGKVTIVNLWATWCPPCRAELPSLQELADRLDPGRFTVIGLSVDDDPDFVREFLRDAGITYPNYMDSGGNVARDQLGVDSYPQTFIFRSDGALADRIVGARDWVSPEIIDRIKILADPPNQPTKLGETQK
jgi:thiol-disulfide isomerase/thioredoxin